MESPPPAKMSQSSSRSPSLVARQAFSKRTAINEFQVQHFCGLCHALIQRTLDRFKVRTSADLPEQGWQAFTQMPEYGLFTSGVYACGFVCSDLAPNVNLEAVNADPAEALSGQTLPQLRHYMHTLMRSERAGNGYGSVLYEALCAGALEVFCARLDRDPDLYEGL